MGSIYSCKECGTNLNLKTADLFPLNLYFEAGNKETFSFIRVDQTKIRLEKEDKIRMFYETLNYWGIQRNRTKIRCDNCGRLLGHIYDDGLPLRDGFYHEWIGPSQAIPRTSRYRFKIKSLLVSSET